jgi:hypothetical protein
MLDIVILGRSSLQVQSVRERYFDRRRFGSIMRTLSHVNTEFQVMVVWMYLQRLVAA